MFVNMLILPLLIGACTVSASVLRDRMNDTQNSHLPAFIGNNSDLSWIIDLEGDDRMDAPVEDRSANSCGCAQVQSTGRIVGGAVVKPYSLPYQAFIVADRFSCGGTILNKRYVLTAMHCIYDPNKKKIPSSKVIVMLGEHNTCDGVNEGGKVYKVEKYVEHPKYKPGDVPHDIAILKLSEDIKFSDKIKPACLPTDKTKMYSKTMSVVSGYGGTVGYKPGQSVKQKTSCTLKATSIQVLEPKDTKCMYLTGSEDKKVICGYSKGTDSCQGDSGGPMTVNENGKHVVVGVVSWGIGCAGDTPGIYSRVTNYLDWITQNIADGNCSGTSSSTTTKATSSTTKTTTTTAKSSTTTSSDYNYGNYNYVDYNG